MALRTSSPRSPSPLSALQASLLPSVPESFSEILAMSLEIIGNDITSACLKNRNATINMTRLNQFTTFTNYFLVERDIIQLSIHMLKVFKLA